MIEQRVDIATPDGTMPTFIVHPAEGGPYPIVLYLMDAPSIRPALHDMASRLASAGYYVMMPFLYYRHSPFREFGTSDEEMHERRTLMESVNRAGTVVDADALLLHARASEFAAHDRPAGAVGFCMSGPLVLGLTQRMPERFAAGASIHGAWLVTDQDDSPHLELDQIQADLYFGWADNDPTATRDEKLQMETALRDAGVSYRLDFFENAVHGYAPAGERYNRAASERHWEMVHAMFRRRLSA